MSKKLGFFIRKSDTGKKVSAVMPLLDVVVVLLMKGEKILSVYNQNWGSFTLPMSKRRTWQDPESAEGSEHVEDWEDAAIRAAAEWLRKTMTGKPEFLLDMSEFQQSDRDAKWKRYHIQVFKISMESTEGVGGGRAVEWLTADEFIDEHRCPMSPTARHVMNELKLRGLV